MVHRASTLDGIDAWADELPLELAAGGDRLGNQERPLDDERALLVPGTATTEQAAQSLNLWAGESQLSGRRYRADRAASTRRPKATGSVTARSARILRSTSIPAAESPAMNRL